MPEILKEGLKVSPELARMEQADRARLIEKGAKFFEEAGKKAKLNEKQSMSARESFYREIIHHFANGRTGKAFVYRGFVHAEELENKGILPFQIRMINEMAREHVQGIHKLGQTVAKKYGKKKM